MDIFLPLLGLIAIIAFLVGATAKLNKIMTGNKINFLENKTLTFGIALFFICLYLSAIIFGYFDGFVYYWHDFLSFAFSIALIYAVGKYTPDLIAYLRELHQSNLEDAEEQELKNVE